jgi:hypothetical protein
MEGFTYGFRVMKKKDEDTGSDIYEVHEVWFDENGKICGWTENPTELMGFSKEDLHEELDHIVRDVKSNEALDYYAEPESDALSNAVKEIENEDP